MGTHVSPCANGLQIYNQSIGRLAGKKWRLELDGSW
jgi:hypothetical protein